ncbi:MAG: TIGR02646 family protein [Desulfobacteraceae bacterium]|nr:TIGR02646 family protein [Desulfobacteraceae bacterium]
MKYIKKNKEPDSLKKYRCSADPNKTYDNYSDNGELRKSLLEEQGYICCYCMKRIPDKNGRFKIEHWKPQSPCPDLQLEYKNLLASCFGGEGGPKHMQHCDTHKADQKITINPTDPNCESLVKFERKKAKDKKTDNKSESDPNYKRVAKCIHSLSGEITSDNQTIKDDLNEILNLNLQTIVENRRYALDKFLELFVKKHPSGTWNRTLIERVIKKWSSPLNNRYEEYCQIVVYYLRTKL